MGIFPDGIVPGPIAGLPLSPLGEDGVCLAGAAPFGGRDAPVTQRDLRFPDGEIRTGQPLAWVRVAGRLQPLLAHQRTGTLFDARSGCCLSNPQLRLLAATPEGSAA